MKKLACLSLLFLFTASAFAQGHFTVSGNIKGLPNGKVAIKYTSNDNKTILDSCILKNGNFHFQGDISGPVIAYLLAYKGDYSIINDSDPNSGSFFLEPAAITVNGTYNHLKELEITGSKTQTEYDELLLQLGEFDKQVKKTSALFDETNKLYEAAKKDSLNIAKQDSLKQRLEAIRADYETFDAKRGDIAIGFFKNHPASHASSFFFQFYIQSLPIDSVKAIYNSFSAQVKTGLYGVNIKKFIDDTDASSIGRRAKDFATIDINSKPVHLSDFAGKVVLLDFWASWCVPCRQSTPHLVELFKKYQKKLNVIAISDDDDNPKAWKKAIDADGTEIWTNVLRGMKYSKDGTDHTNSIYEKFAIHAIPVRILIDQTGIIVGRYGGSEDNDALDEKLAAIFSNAK